MMEIDYTLDGPEWAEVFKERPVKTYRIHFVSVWWFPFLRDRFVDVKLQSPCFPTWEGVGIGRQRLGRKRNFMKWKSVKLLNASYSENAIQVLDYLNTQ